MKIGIMGASGVGKTTLATRLSEELGIYHITEVVRHVSKDSGISNTNEIMNLSPGKLMSLEKKCLSKQIQEEDAHHSFVSDRTVIDYIIYSTMYGVSLSSYGFDYLEMSDRYDVIFFIPIHPSIPLRNDGFRHLNVEMRNELNDVFEYIANSLVNSHIIKSVEIDDRVNEAMSILSEKYI